MPSYDIAHIREQGQDIIIVFMSPAFSSLGNTAQNEQQTLLQACAADANLAGTVVPVWKAGSTFGFLAPSPWQSYFRNSTWDDLCLTVNKKLTCTT